MSTACPDWGDRLKRGESIIPEPLFNRPADRALEIFQSLRVPDVAGKPTFGEVSPPWVFDFVRAVFGGYDENTGNQLIKNYLLCLSKKNGKALALDTPIPVPGGWATMGDIKVGDNVFGVDGNPCKVTHASPIYTDHDCYRLTFSNGETVVADAGHQWVTDSLQDRETKYKTRTTQDIFNSLRRKDGASNHSLLMPGALQCSKATLPIAPYTLGAWLGDGTSTAADITNMDIEVLQGIEADGYKVKYKSNNGGNASTYVIKNNARDIMCIRGHLYADYGVIKSGHHHCLKCARQMDKQRRDGTGPDKKIARSVYEILKREGLIKNKHIPDLYMRASFEQRASLLRGLMDTDGTISKSGLCLVYSGTNKRLCEDVRKLLSTMGIKSTSIKRAVSCNGKPAGYSYNVQFHAFHEDIKVFSIKRKLNRMRNKSDLVMKIPRSRRVQIVDAERVPPVPVKCIMVDSPDHQFLFSETILPTHNSLLSAGVMLTMLITNWRENEEHLIVSPTKEIAGNSFSPAAAMVRADEDLSDLLQVRDHIKTIQHRANGNTLKVVASDTDTLSGKRAGHIFVDELWVFGTRYNAEAMLMEALGGMVSRPEGWVIYATTQSDEPPAGVFKARLDYFRSVRDGEIEDSESLPVIYEFPKDMLDDKLYLKPENFHITNPNLGYSVSRHWLETNLKQRTSGDDQPLTQFLAKHLNIEMGMDTRAGRWAGCDFWEQCAADMTLDSLVNRSDVCVVGIDGGGLDDLLGLAVIGRDAETGLWLHWAHAWAHEIVMVRRGDIAPRLKDFAKDGDLTVVKNPGDDVHGVADTIAGISHMLPSKNAIGVDQAGIGDIVDGLVARGNIEFNQIVGISQGWKLNAAIKTTERKLAGRQMEHCGSAMMNWVVSNAVQKPRGNAVMITKAFAGSAKIDPLMATFDAISLMALNPEAKTKRPLMFTL